MKFKYYMLYLKSPSEKKKLSRMCFDIFLSEYQEKKAIYSIEEYIFKKRDLQLMADLYYRQYASDSQRKKYEQCVQKHKLELELNRRMSKKKKLSAQKETSAGCEIEKEEPLSSKQVKEYMSVRKKVIRVFKKYRDSDFQESVLREECKNAKCSILTAIYYIEEVAMSDMSKEEILKFRSIKEVSERENSKEESIERWKKQQEKIISILDFLITQTKEEAILFLEEKGKKYKDPYFLFHRLEERVEQYALYFEISPEKQQFLVDLVANYYIRIKNSRKQIYDMSLYKRQQVERNNVKKQAIIKQFRQIVMNGQKINDYCQQQGISREKLSKDLQTIKKDYPDIFQEYLAYQRSLEESYINYESYVLKLLSCLNEKGASFEELDYYLYIGIDPNDLKKCAYKICTKDELVRICVILGNLSKLMPYKETIIYESKEMIQIDGKFVELTLNQKQEIISFLKENNVPLSLRIYQQAKKRYLMGSLQVPREPEGTLTKPFQKKITI